MKDTSSMGYSQCAELARRFKQPLFSTAQQDIRMYFHKNKMGGASVAKQDLPIITSLIMR